MKNLAKTRDFLLYLFVVIVVAEARNLAEPLVSDGVDGVETGCRSPNLFLEERDYVSSSSDGDEECYCEQMYGFLPCSSSVYGNIFLIFVYEYLLFRGESYLGYGGEQMFKILGPGFFGASAFQILGALPESLILLASGLMNSKEVAQEYAYTGVGLLAGSSILLLTLIWGNLFDCRKPSSLQQWITLFNPPYQFQLYNLVISQITTFFERTDQETSYTARIMVVSVTPFLIIQLLKIFPPAAKLPLIFIAFTISILFLLCYFFYQFFQPWIQKRRLEFVKHEHLILKILQHVQKHAIGRILTHDGAPNVHAIRRLFEELDKDGDDCVSALELKALLVEVKFTKSQINKEKAIEDIMKEFDIDGDRKITRNEFLDGFTKWLDQAKEALDKRYYSQKSLSDIYRVFQPWIENKRKEREMDENLISELLSHFQSNTIGSLLTDDGKPDTTAINRLFETIDKDGDNCISQQELEELISDVKFGTVPLNPNEIVAKVIEELDTSGDRKIDQDEFINGISKWLKTSQKEATTPSSNQAQDDFYHQTWEETDKLVDEEKSNGVGDNASKQAWVEAILYMVLGIIILGFLAEPLIHSVQSFSKAANIPSFFISFILVPLTTNARVASAAIAAAWRKKPRTTSLTFSEIYSGALMNNVVGFAVLLALVYARGLSWEFSGEVLVVLMVCLVMGLIASFSSNFPLWMSFLAFVLYPLSLFLVYFLNDVLNYD
ncbi:hypothetical protein GQ457_02G037970 [Hibiscus cannabinus]